ncbi:hypothetical protein WJX73_008875 [Symbiochloris irregularis]|uniref:Uncharacterized protein n=1 Tax=Symbiochloris irregularis TaxID=706552 RepID=A0AAW1NS30_9CHLO
MHVHITGVTTVVGVIGTDSVSRSQENLIAKCQALNAEGITAYHWCGGYRFPVQTATGDVQRDLLLLQSCLGVGEVAVSDHRGSPCHTTGIGSPGQVQSSMHTSNVFDPA